MNILCRSVVVAAGLGAAAAGAENETQPEVHDFGRIVVESGVLDRTADELAEPVEVLQGRSLEQRRSGNIGELLGSELGISSSSFGPGVGRPVIRGQSGARVQVLENGIRTMDLSTIAADHAVSVDPLLARRVEVIKGPATLIYGSSAIGGVVNVLNNRMPKHFEQGFSGVAAGSYADNASARLFSADVTYGFDDFAIQGDIGIERSNDFDIPGFQNLDGTGRRGVLENSSMDNISGALSASYAGERGYLGLAWSRLDDDYGIPEVIDPEDPEFERIELVQDRVDLRGELRDPFPGFRRARLAFGINDYTHDEVEFEDGEREIHARFDNDEWDLRLDASHHRAGPLSGVIGVHFTRRDFIAGEPEGDDHDEADEHEDDGFFVPPTKTTSQAIFIVEEMELDATRLEFGARYERNRSTPERGHEHEDEHGHADRASFGLFSASVSAVREIDEHHHLTVALNRAERAPAAEELFADGRHGASRTFEIGNPDFRAERAYELDIGLDRHTEDWSWRLNAFYSRFRDYVYPELQVDADGAVVLVDDAGGFAGELRNRLLHYRQDAAEFHGIEAETRFNLVDDGPVLVNARVFGDFVRGRLRGGGGDLPRITPARAGFSLDLFRGALDGNLELVRTRSQTRTAQGETVTDGYTTLSFDLGYTVTRPATEARIFLRGRNLLDAEIRQHTSFLKDFAPQPGRSLTAGVRVSF